jgi:hypothetical protein
MSVVHSRTSQRQMAEHSVMVPTSQYYDPSHTLRTKAIIEIENEEKVNSITAMAESDDDRKQIEVSYHIIAYHFGQYNLLFSAVAFFIARKGGKGRKRYQ